MGQGSISGSTNIVYGESADLTFTPEDGFVVADVLIDGVSVGAVSSYSLDNVTSNHTIEVHFNPA